MRDLMGKNDLQKLNFQINILVSDEIFWRTYSFRKNRTNHIGVKPITHTKHRHSF